MNDRIRLSITAIILTVLGFYLAGGQAIPGLEPESPIPVPGLHVLIVYESQPTEHLPKEQQAILTTTVWKELVGKGKWRVLDQDSVFNDPNSIWKKALERPSEHLPRVEAKETLHAIASYIAMSECRIEGAKPSSYDKDYLNECYNATYRAEGFR